MVPHVPFISVFVLDSGWAGWPRRKHRGGYCGLRLRPALAPDRGIFLLHATPWLPALWQRREEIAVSGNYAF